MPPQIRIDELVVGLPGKADGVLRLVKFHDVPQKQIRASGQCWDLGGLFDIDVFVQDIDTKLTELQALGYHAYADPVTWNFGALTVRHVLVVIDDGICHAMIQRVAPPLSEQEADFSGFSANFNSTQIVDAQEPSHSFFLETLGFTERFHETWSHDPQEGANIFGLPKNIARDLTAHAVGYRPESEQGGALETLWFEGLEGHDFSERAVPPNLDILMQRFPVENLNGFTAHLERQGIALAAGPARIPIAPKGNANAIAIRAPNGSWLEFYEFG